MSPHVIVKLPGIYNQVKAEQEFSSSYHQTRFKYDPERAAVWRPICRYLQRFTRDNEPLLDLGAGYGEFTRFIEAKEKWALDINPEPAKYWAEGVHPLIQSVLDPLPFAPNVLGTVFTSNLFEHFALDEVRAILCEVRRVLAPDGRLIVVQPNFRLEPNRYYDDYTHKTPFTDVGFADFLAASGWRIVHVEPRFMPFSMKSRLPKWSWLVELYLALPYRFAAGQFLVVAENA